jgi:hypothetical protein
MVYEIGNFSPIHLIDAVTSFFSVVFAQLAMEHPHVLLLGTGNFTLPGRI